MLRVNNLTGTRVSPVLLQPPDLQRAAITVEVTTANGVVRFVTESSDDRVVWQTDHIFDTDGPSRSIVPGRRGQYVRVTKSGARCSVIIGADRGTLQ